MPNNYVNKVVVNGTTKIDLTGDTVQADKVLSGYTFHDKSGAPVTGTSTFNADTSVTTATVGEVLSGKIYVGPTGTAQTGTMSNNGAIDEDISTKTQVITVPTGYHDGSGTVQISSTEQAKIIEANIKQGVQILGVTGTFSGAEPTPLNPGSGNPKFTSYTYTPPAGEGFSQFTVAAIPVVETPNSQGGLTLTINEAS